MIGIIDYGAGNTQSVKNALERIGIDYFLSSSIDELEKANRLILPGVGHASKAMETLEKTKLISYIQNYKKPLLGICLGMQLLCAFSEEGNTKCLNIISESIEKFSTSDLKVPKMGWNQIEAEDSELFKDINAESYFYFVHSYYVPTNKNTIAIADYSLRYSAAIRKNNFYGVQFHPEKSGKAGLELLKNFAQL